ncbi:kinase-like domain-containing protein [Chytriomyces cf. hyalinus JEL632]|nr:kinase-like domain-containing protein [Chytriomyces cf. hyalinus JEL632]
MALLQACVSPASFFSRLFPLLKLPKPTTCCTEKSKISEQQAEQLAQALNTNQAVNEMALEHKELFMKRMNCSESHQVKTYNEHVDHAVVPTKYMLLIIASPVQEKPPPAGTDCAQDLCASRTSCKEYASERNCPSRHEDENIVVDSSYNIKIIDFGSAASVPTTQDDFFSQFHGTALYASPEIVRKEKYRGPETEMWALGVLLYIMVVGDDPFRNAKEIAKGVRLPKGFHFESDRDYSAGKSIRAKPT